RPNCSLPVRPRYADAPQTLRANRSDPETPRPRPPYRSRPRSFRTDAPLPSPAPIASSRSSGTVRPPPRLHRARSARGASRRAAEHTQPRDPAVRIDIEPHLRHVADRADIVLEGLPHVRLQRRSRHNLVPFRTVERPLEAEGLGRVPLEMAR